MGASLAKLWNVNHETKIMIYGAANAGKASVEQTFAGDPAEQRVDGGMKVFVLYHIITTGPACIESIYNKCMGRPRFTIREGVYLNVPTEFHVIGAIQAIAATSKSPCLFLRGFRPATIGPQLRSWVAVSQEGFYLITVSYQPAVSRTPSSPLTSSAPSSPFLLRPPLWPTSSRPSPAAPL